MTISLVHLNFVFPFSSTSLGLSTCVISKRLRFDDKSNEFNSHCRYVNYRRTAERFSVLFLLASSIRQVKVSGSMRIVCAFPDYSSLAERDRSFWSTAGREPYIPAVRE
jgi:hypothetical protein